MAVLLPTKILAVILSKNKKAGQVTVEYILLLVVISVIFVKVMHHVQEVFYGQGGQMGAIELFMKYQVSDKLSTPQGWL
ncbi:MAG: hypothetical protein NTY22_07645 [Proteobacteria bacterium]|nr:hypothetical protein [Pseudomonadota bacterium]